MAGPLHVGLMSGTSVDGIDAVLADLSGHRPALLTTLSHDYPAALRSELLAFAEGRYVSDPVDQLGRLDQRVGIEFGRAAGALIRKAGRRGDAIAAIGSHGQTVRHRPGPPAPFTLQIGDPNVIAELTGITTVADFRRRDVAAGGQGAPLAPAFHRAFFASASEDRVVVNIGGMANLTRLPARGTATGADTGPGNALLDGWTARHRDEAFDRDGAWARSGEADPELLDAMLADPFLQRRGPKSTGREQFNLAWLDAHLERLGRAVDAASVQATLVELTAASIAGAIRADGGAPDTVLVAGGGTRNGFLMERLAARLAGARVTSTAAEGLDPEWVEATGFAWLAERALARAAGNVPAVTGAVGERILGGIYPA